MARRRSTCWTVLALVATLIGARPALGACGDGLLDGAEQCDDANTAGGDGCSTACVLEPPAGCGNGTVDTGESCDDGNTTSGDGRSSLCLREASCIDDVTGRTNTCTANDVKLTLVTVFSELDGCAFPGDMATILTEGQLIAGANERYDIGIFLAQDGGSARTGTCFQEYLPPPLAANGTCSVSGAACQKDADCPAGETCNGGYDPNGGAGPFYNAEEVEDAADTCGDLEQGVSTLTDLGALRIRCIDSDADGNVDLGACTSWDNAKSDGSAIKPSCTSASQAVPNTKSKCN
jgi:cysteine-rich repeat protein